MSDEYEYVVKRHSGRNADEWRDVLRTTDKAKAERRYTRLYVAMRQGGVWMIRNDGDGRQPYITVARAVAPRVRTRW